MSLTAKYINNEPLETSDDRQNSLIYKSEVFISSFIENKTTLNDLNFFKFLWKSLKCF